MEKFHGISHTFKSFLIKAKEILKKGEARGKEIYSPERMQCHPGLTYLGPARRSHEHLTLR